MPDKSTIVNTVNATDNALATQLVQTRANQHRNCCPLLLHCEQRTALLTVNGELAREPTTQGTSISDCYCHCNPMESDPHRSVGVCFHPSDLRTQPQYIFHLIVSHMYTYRLSFHTQTAQGT